MTTEDLKLIEQALGITLPESYRARMAPYPVPAASGNSDLGVWDDADGLIELNLELRAGAPGGVTPWPRHFFAIGDPGDGCPFALDLSNGGAVWWIDHSHLENPGSYKVNDSFAEWADDYFGTLREEMLGEEVDPDGTPAHRAAIEERNARSSAMAAAIGCLAMIAAFGGVALAVRWLLK